MKGEERQEHDMAHKAAISGFTAMLMASSMLNKLGCTLDNDEGLILRSGNIGSWAPTTGIFFFLPALHVETEQLPMCGVVQTRRLQEGFPQLLTIGHQALS